MSIVISAAGQDAVREISRAAAGAAFSETEKQVLDSYYGERLKQYARHIVDEERRYQDDDEDRDRGSSGRTKGKGKNGHAPKGKGRKELPPGIAMKLERGGELPPGIAKRGLPQDLTDRLPPVPTGLERAVIDDKVVLIEVATGLIRDLYAPGSGRSSPPPKAAPEPLAPTPQSDAVDDAPARATPAGEAEPGKKWWEFWRE
jgi:hypothetical protein